MTKAGMVIVGAGEAGVSAAVELRSQGWEGPVTLIGEERCPPYERPPLSKDCLVNDEPAPVYIREQSVLDELEITFMAGAKVEQIDRFNRTVAVSGGRKIGYEKLLLATGARPRQLNLDGAGLSQILYLRTYGDAVKLRSRLQAGKHVVIIGGGFIGLEVAASATKRGCRVTLLEAGPRILMRGVPQQIAAIVEARHKAHDVQFHYGTGIAGIRTSNHEQVITLTDGTVISCDAIVAGIGAVPETVLAADCGLEIENGIRVNEQLQTSDPDIYAAGDCCSFPHPLYGSKRIRLEAWRNAQRQGSHAARNMLGGKEPYAEVPWFWSDQYDLLLQVSGLADQGEQTVVRDLGESGQLFFHLTRDGRLVCASGIGTTAIAKEIRVAEMLIGQQAVLSMQALADPKIKLKTLLQHQTTGGVAASN